MSSKKCKSCNQNKSYDRFYRCKTNLDGIESSCKDCRKYSIESKRLKRMEDPIYAERKRAKDRVRKRILNAAGKVKRKSRKQSVKSKGKYNVKFPEKYRAKTAVANSDLPKAGKGYHRHHWSYNTKDQIDVIKISIRDHGFIHRFLVYDPTSFYYFGDGVLLDTKEKHLKYINKVIELNKE